MTINLKVKTQENRKRIQNRRSYENSPGMSDTKVSSNEDGENGTWKTVCQERKARKTVDYSG